MFQVSNQTRITQEAIMERLEDLRTLDRLEIHGFMTMAPWTPERKNSTRASRGFGIASTL